MPAPAPTQRGWKRSRAATENIIPTTTGAARAVGKVLPELAGQLKPNGEAGAGRRWLDSGPGSGTLRRSHRRRTERNRPGGRHQAVLGDSGVHRGTGGLLRHIGNLHSSIFGAGATDVLGANLVRTLAWYDNEWGYSNRVVDLIERLAKLTD